MSHILMEVFSLCEQLKSNISVLIGASLHNLNTNIAIFLISEYHNECCHEVALYLPLNILHES